MLLALLPREEGHGPPATIFTPLWNKLNEHYGGQDQSWWHWMGFDTVDRHLGQFWFEAVCFSVLSALVLAVCGLLATRRYDRVPRGLQNVFELGLIGARKIVHSMIGPAGEPYVPFVGTLFLFIMLMNLIGIIPGFRSPTMTLSTTAALAITTFLVVQIYAIRAGGLLHYLRHFAGDIIALAPLMVVVELFGELAKPLSLSLRLFGNIYGEDVVVEQLMILGGWVPVQAPMLLLAIFTSIMQAFVFSALTSLYIGMKLPHEHGEHEEQGGPGAEKASHHAH